MAGHLPAARHSSEFGNFRAARLGGEGTARMEKAARRGIAKTYSHVQRPNRQVFLHAVTGCPTDNAATVQVEYDSQPSNVQT